MLLDKTSLSAEDEKRIIHAQKMAEEFSPKRVTALRKELEVRRSDIMSMLPYTDITTEMGKAQYWKLQGELELIDTWLKLPTETKSFLDLFKDKLQKFFVS